MANNQVYFGNTKIIDLTDATATAADIATGKTAYGKEGTLLTGTAAGSSYTLIGSAEFTANITSTSAVSVGYIDLGATGWTSDKILYVKVRDKAGPRAGYFSGSDNWILNFYDFVGTTSTLGIGVVLYTRKTTATTVTRAAALIDGYGVFVKQINSAGRLYIYGRYGNNYSATINGTYTVEAYLVDYAPKTGNPFDF